MGSKGIEILEKLLKDNPVRNTAEEELVQYQNREYLGNEKYSYEWFVNKPNMMVTALSAEIPKNRADVVRQAKKNAAAIGKTNSDGGVSVHVNDIDTDVLLSTAGLRHGLDRRFNINAPVTLQIGEILANSIRVNEAIPSIETADSSYVLIGAAHNEKDELYIVRSVVNSFSNELMSIDVLYAVNAKTEPDLGKKRTSRELIPKVHGLKTASFLVLLSV